MTSIAGIGYGPLGTYGLGMSGQFGSYDAYMPSMYGMSPSMYGMGMNPSIFGMNGMYGMYNPAFMANMYQQVEASQAQHSGNMHEILLNNEINAHRHTDSALVKKILTNADIQRSAANLYDKVKSGDQDGICQEFDNLRDNILNTYRDEFAAMGDKINPITSASQYAEHVYGNLATAWAGDGKTHSFRDDVIKYGDSSLQNGFMSGLVRGHHDRYVDETLNHCIDLRIDHKESKDRRQALGNGLGRVVSVLAKGAIGGGIGLGVGALGIGTIKGINALFPKHEIVENGTKEMVRGWSKIAKMPWGGPLKFLAVAGIITGIVADIFWQNEAA